MKTDLVNRLPFVLAVLLCTMMNSCDTEKSLFDPEKVKEDYKKTFPVQNIDPSMDWKTTRTAQVSVIVNEDLGTNYKVQIYDANPLTQEGNAKLLVEGIANRELAFQTTMDCPKALTTVFVARVNAKGQYLVQPVPVENGTITAHFGEAPTTVRSRAMTRADASAVPTIAAPYTDEQINSLLAGATEVANGWDLTANFGAGEAGQGDVFKQTDRVFKITNPGTKAFSSRQSGKNVKLIIAADGVVLPTDFSNSLEIIVARGARIALNNTVSLKTNCRMIVMPGGTISGTGTLAYTNRSYGALNYNGGTIDINKLDFTGSGDNTPPNGEYPYYNYGVLKLNLYSTSTPNSVLVNRGQAYFGELYGNNNTDVKSACYLEVTGNIYCRNLVVGSNSMVKCGSLTHNAGTELKIDLESNAMLNCLGAANLTRQVTGPSTGSALFKMRSVVGNLFDDANQSFIRNNVICEVEDQTSNNGVRNDWSATKNYTWTHFDWLVCRLLQDGATYCNPGKANFTLPAGDCTGEGYNDDGEEDPVIIVPMAYTYAFEDNFPYPGDYDFNDIVFDVAPKYFRDSGNKIQKIGFVITLRAIGGIKVHGAALRLVGVQKSEISQIEFSDPNSMRATLGNQLFDNVTQEPDENAIVIPLFADAHKIVGQDRPTGRPLLNTTPGVVSFAPVTMTMTLTLADQTKTDPILTGDKLDFFIAYPGTLQGVRTEVHLFEFRGAGATAKGNVFPENLAAAGKITWAVKVPEFKYPVEQTVITKAYPDFENWATSGGLNPEFAEWYKNPTTEPNKIY